MKITIVGFTKGIGEMSIIDVNKTEQDLNQIDDYDIRHLILENKQLRINKEVGLPITCSFHLEWCLNGLVNMFGKQPFTNQLIKEEKSDNNIPVI